MESTKDSFPVLSNLEFCPNCGCILPMVSNTATNVECQRCSFKRSTKDYSEVVEEFTIHFNTSKKRKNKNDEEENTSSQTEEQPAFAGPTVERNCPRCESEIMTYTTRQTRSADEGQTVFYTCIQCKFQDIEYS